MSGQKNKTSWRDLLLNLAASKQYTPAGAFNIRMSIVLLIGVLLSVVPGFLEVIANAFLTFHSRPTVETVDKWVANFAVVTFLVEAFICTFIIVKQQWKISKK